KVRASLPRLLRGPPPHVGGYNLVPFRQIFFALAFSVSLLCASARIRKNVEMPGRTTGSVRSRMFIEPRPQRIFFVFSGAGMNRSPIPLLASRAAENTETVDGRRSINIAFLTSS